ALRLEDDSVAYQFDPEAAPSPARTAERWWWLSEIARARGDEEETRRRLSRAAAQPLTEFGSRAAQALRRTMEAAGLHVEVEGGLDAPLPVLGLPGKAVT